MSRAVTGAAVGALAATLHTALNVRLLRRPPAGASTELLSVLVPARNEAARIGGCVRALLASRGADLELLVGDDGSTDGTAQVAQDAAAGDARLRIVTGAPLADGWLGKPAMCAQLAERARGSVLVFVDADVEVAPDGIARTARLLRDAGLDLVSPYPRQLAEGVGPRLVQPLLQWSWLTFLPLRLAERLPAPSLTAANGQLLACDAAAYAKAGSHAAVRDAVVEDVALARAFKRSGARVGMADGTAVATCRMYAAWDDLREGYMKSLWSAFGPPPGAVAVMGLLCWLYVLPPVAACLARRRRTALVGLAGYTAGVAGRVVTARATGARQVDAFAHPASVLAVAWLTARSWTARRRSRLTWKGRPVR